MTSDAQRFLVVGLVVERTSAGTFQHGAWAWQFPRGGVRRRDVCDAMMFSGQLVYLAPCVLFRRFSLLGDRAMWPERSAPQVSSLHRPCIWCAATLRRRFTRLLPTMRSGVTDHWLTKLANALDVDFFECKTVLTVAELAAILAKARQHSQG